MSKVDSCKCRPLSAAARIQGYYEANETPGTDAVRVIPTGDFLSIDMKPFILVGGLYLAYLILKKKHA